MPGVAMFNRFSLIVTLGLSTAGSIALLSPASASTPLNRAVLENIRNEVRLKQQNQAFRPARRQDAMVPGDALSTARRALAELRFNDGSMARLGEQSIFQFLPGLRSAYLEQGTALLLIKPGQGQTRVRTPNATAGIRGSALFVRYIPETLITIVGALTNSEIEVANQDGNQKYVLGAGQMAVFVDRQLRAIYNFSLDTFYQSSPLVEGLDLSRRQPSASADPAIAAVQAETAEALKKQVPLAEQGIVVNPGFIKLVASTEQPAATAIAPVDDTIERDRVTGIAAIVSNTTRDGRRIPVTPTVQTVQQPTQPAQQPTPPTSAPAPPLPGGNAGSVAAQPVQPSLPTVAPAPPLPGGNAGSIGDQPAQPNLPTVAPAPPLPGGNAGSIAGQPAQPNLPTVAPAPPLPGGNIGSAVGQPTQPNLPTVAPAPPLPSANASSTLVFPASRPGISAVGTATGSSSVIQPVNVTPTVAPSGGTSVTIPVSTPLVSTPLSSVTPVNTAPTSVTAPSTLPSLNSSNGTGLVTPSSLSTPTLPNSSSVATPSAAIAAPSQAVLPVTNPSPSIGAGAVNPASAIVQPVSTTPIAPVQIVQPASTIPAAPLPSATLIVQPAPVSPTPSLSSTPVAQPVMAPVQPTATSVIQPVSTTPVPVNTTTSPSSTPAVTPATVPAASQTP